MRKLREKIVQMGTTQEAVADCIGVDRSTFYRKMKGQGLSFSVYEVQRIAGRLELSQMDVMEFFLDMKSHKCD